MGFFDDELKVLMREVCNLSLYTAGGFVIYKILQKMTKNLMRREDVKKIEIELKKMIGVYKEQQVSDRLKHAWYIGESGTGKTTFLENMMYKDIVEGRGICFIDVHGNSAKRLGGSIPENRIKDVVYIAPYRLSNKIGINPLKHDGTLIDKLNVVNSVLGVFERMFSSNWGVSTEDLIRMALMGVIDRKEEVTLYDVYLMLADEEYREDTIRFISDPLVKRFWQEDFKNVSKSNLNPPMNKLRQFIANDYVRNTLCMKNSKIDMLDIMNKNKILIIDLDQSKLTEPVSNSLAGFFVSALQVASKKRGFNKNPYFIYLDEFQSYANESLKVFVSECRKFNVGLIISHQYISQLSEGIIKALVGNVGTRGSFRVGEDDSYRISNLLGVDRKILESMPNYHICERRLVEDKIESAKIYRTPLPIKTDRTVLNTVMLNSTTFYGSEPVNNLIQIKQGNAMGLD